MIAATGCALVLGLGSAALAEHVEPAAHAGNPKCADLNPDWNELKVDQAPNGTHSDTHEGDNPGGPGPLEFTIANSDGKEFDWTANMGVDAVIVKGGNNGANVYTYDPESAADNRLRSPDNTSGNVPQISHISACYDVEDDTGNQNQGDDDDNQDDTGNQNQGDDDNNQDDTGNQNQRDGNGPEEPQEDGAETEGDQRGGGGKRPADPEAPESDGGERPADPEEQGADVRGEEETSPRQPAAREDGGRSDGGVRGVTETSEGAGDDVAEETASGGGGDDEDLPFTGLPLVGLLLIGVGLILTGAGARAAARGA